jgi:hypothetical protein
MAKLACLKGFSLPAEEEHVENYVVFLRSSCGLQEELFMYADLLWKNCCAKAATQKLLCSGQRRR